MVEKEFISTEPPMFLCISLQMLYSFNLGLPILLPRITVSGSNTYSSLVPVSVTENNFILEVAPIFLYISLQIIYSLKSGLHATLDANLCE